MLYIHVLHKASHLRDNFSDWGSQCLSSMTVKNLCNMADEYHGSKRY